MKLSFGKILLAFTIIPFVELSILLRIAEATSFLTTLGIIVVTGVVGAYFARQQGQHALRAIRRDLNQGQMPTNSMLDGLCVLIGGVLLLTPGILTDIVGFAMVLPISRPVFKRWLKQSFSGVLHTNTVHIYSQGTHRAAHRVEDDIVIIEDDERVHN